jgi:hypothetical protein
MKSTHALFALLAATTLVAMTSDLSAGTRHSRGRSRPIFGSRSYSGWNSDSGSWGTAFRTTDAVAAPSGCCESVCAPCCRPRALCVTSFLKLPVAAAANTSTGGDEP